MKNQTNLLKLAPVVLLVGALSLTIPLPRAKADPRPTPGVVVFAANQYYENGYPVGYVVIVVSQGQHAPQVLPGADLATTLENLLANGFEITNLPGLQFMATNARR